MKKILAYKRIYFLVFIPISLVLTYAAKNSSFFAEQIFAKHIYKWISQIISMITGFIPFSIAEVLVVIIPVAMLILLIRFIILMIMDKSNRKKRLFKGILNVLCCASIVLFLYTICGGLNYYRYTFSSYSNLEIRNSTVEELYSLTQSLALQADDLRAQISQTDEDGVFQLSESSYQLAKDANKAYKALAEDYPILSGSYGSAKPVVFSELMSSTEITGIFFPFTSSP